MQSALLLSFVATSSLPPCGLQSTHPPMRFYISPYVVYNVYGREYVSRTSRESSEPSLLKQFFLTRPNISYYKIVR